MKRINIQDILDEYNSYFHFTDESHLYDEIILNEVIYQ